MDAPERFEAPLRLHLASDAVLDSFGSMADTAGAHALSVVRAAALSPSGRFLAVGEYYSSPFVHVFDRVTESVVSFGTEGRGPGELQAIYALEFLGDSVLLALGASGRLERYSVDGEWLGGYSVARAGLAVSSITSGCNGRVFAYAMEVGESGGTKQSLPWIHEIFLHDELASEARLTLPMSALSMKWGALNGFDGTGEGILLWDKDGLNGYWMSCDSAEPQVWYRGRSAELTVSADPRGMVLRLPDTLFAGAVARNAEKYLARNWKDSGTGVTGLSKVTDEACGEVELIGHWKLHDAHPQAVVLATEEPYPTVKLVSWDFHSCRRRITHA